MQISRLRRMIGGEDPAEPGVSASHERAGWYADPFGREAERWWDGMRWTARTRGPSRPDEAAVVPEAEPVPAPPPAPAAQPRPEDHSPSRWLVGVPEQPEPSPGPAAASPEPAAPSPEDTMSLEEFTREGYLQELHRRFLHPLGLELELEPATESIELVRFAPGAAQQLLSLLDRLLEGGLCTAAEVDGWRAALRRAERIDEGQVVWSAVRDLRADPEGGRIPSGNAAERRWRRENIDHLWAQRRPAREARFGGMLQDL